jgi:cyclohexyl-isocyanide hydratase
MMEDDETLAWVRHIGEKALWVTSVCTGSLILGAARLLHGYRAACHWAWRDHLSLFGATPVAERVVFDRNRATGGGVTAGVDFAFALMAAIRGEDHARLVQLGLEYAPHGYERPQAPESGTRVTGLRPAYPYDGSRASGSGAAAAASCPRPRRANMRA